VKCRDRVFTRSRPEADVSGAYRTLQGAPPDPAKHCWHASDATHAPADAQCIVSNRSGRIMAIEALLSAALREAGYGPDAIGSAMPRILRILEAEDVRIEMGRSLSRKEREYVRLQLELGLGVSEVVAGLKKK
jgi:hypothetical protein